MGSDSCRPVSEKKKINLRVSMRKFVVTVKLVFLFTILSKTCIVVAEDKNDMFEIIKASKNVYIVGQNSLSNGNTKLNFGVVVGNEHVVLITSMMREFAPAIEKLVGTITNKPIKYVFNINSDTYQHEANEYFAKKGASIISHENMRNTDVFVQLTFQDKLSLDIGNELITAYHTPAHTNDNAIVYLKNSNIIFMGDAYRNDWLVYAGENGLTGQLQGFDFVSRLVNEKTKIVPGNRATLPYSGINGFKESVNTYKKFADKVNELYKKGLDIEAISKSSEIHAIVNRLERYEENGKHLHHHVYDILHEQIKDIKN